MIASDIINIASSSVGRLSGKTLQRAQVKRTSNGSLSISAPADHLAGDLASSIDNEGWAKVIGIIWYTFIAYN